MSNRNRQLEKYLPAVYFAAGLALLAAALPSALRPPVDPSNTSAEFSPDAPPDEEQESILAALNRGVSQTAGAGDDGEGDGDDPTGVGPPETTIPQPPPPARSCPSGVGDPPRQVESVYAPTCAPAFHGDNGGATYQGVTASELRIGVRGTTTQGGTSGDCSEWGRVDDIEDRTAAERTYYVLQQYFNQNFQFWGRRVTFYCVDPTDFGAEQQREAAQMADEEFEVFAVNASNTIYCRELARRKLVAFCDGLSEDMHEQWAPYLWTSWLTSTPHAAFIAELICKSLVGKPPEWAGDEVRLRNPVRKFGLIQQGNSEDAENIGGAHARQISRFMTERCGEPLEIVYHNGVTDPNLNATLVQMRQAGVTSIIPSMDFVSLASLTNSAAGSGYLPEWIVNDSGGISRNQLGQFQNPTAWQHAFGITGTEPERPNNATECYRAYRSIDPNNSPQETFCIYLWRSLMLLVTGLQMAGPELTPESFQRGLYDLGMRFWTEPIWPIGGGFAPGTWGYPKNIVLSWWDPDASDPRNGQAGAYRYLNGARRYCAEQIPDDVSGYFGDDSITTTPDWDEVAAKPPQPTCPPA